jgi:hypothetical protein
MRVAEVQRLPVLVWLQENITKPYLKEIAGKPWAASAQESLEDVALDAWRFILNTNSRQKPKTADTLAKLAAQVPEDPWLGFTAAAARYLRNPSGSYKDLALAADKLPATENFTTRRFLAWTLIRFAKAKRKEKGQAAWNDSLQNYLALFEAALAKDSFRDERAAYAIFRFLHCPYSSRRENLNVAFIGKFEEIFERQSGHIPEWAYLTFLGVSEMDRAWEGRGGGYANSVSQKGWEIWTQSLNKARKHFIRSWQINPGHPVAAATMVEVVMGDSDNSSGTARQWFDRAAQASAGWPFAYEFYMQTLLPQWGGSWAEMEAFAKAALAAGTKPGVEGWEYAAQMVGDDDLNGSMMLQVGDVRTFFRKDGVGKALVHIFKNALEKSDRRDIKRDYYLSALALYAWLSGDYTEAHSALEALRWNFRQMPFHNAIWAFRRFHRPRMEGEVAVYCEGGAGVFAQGMAEYEKRNFTAAAAHFAGAETRSTTDRAKHWAKVMRLAAEASIRLEKNGVVNLALPEFIEAWVHPNDIGVHSVAKDSLRAIAGNTDASSYFTTMVPLPSGDFEVTAKIKMNLRDVPSAYSGLVISSLDILSLSVPSWMEDDGNRAEKDIFIHTTDRGKKASIFVQGRRGYTRPKVPFVAATEYVLRMEYRGGVLRGWANGKLVLPDTPIKSVHWTRSVFGTKWMAYPKAAFTIEEFTVRKLPLGN